MFVVPQVFDPEKPVYIVGGGASLIGFDFDSLVNKQVIAINMAYRKCPHAEIMFFSDPNFYERNRDSSGHDFWRFQGRHIITTWEGMKPVFGNRISFLDTDKAVQFSEAPAYMGHFGGEKCETGAQAINLAYLAGGRKVALLGFDSAPGKWYGSQGLSEGRTPSKDAIEKNIGVYGRLADYLAENHPDFQVVNCSDRANNFEHVAFDDVEKHFAAPSGEGGGPETKKASRSRRKKVEEIEA